MQTFHKDTVQHALNWATTHIQEIETGTNDLHWKEDRIAWQLLMLLDDVVLALPNAMREQAQACIEAHKRIRETILAEIDARIAERNAQKEASPTSLAAVDSL